MYRLLVCPALAAALSLAIPVANAQEGRPGRLVTWNLANLYAVDGVPLRSRAAARQQADFDRLARYVTILDADVIALQEIDSIEAIQRVLGKNDYEIVIDGRRDADIAAGLKPPAEGGNGATETDGIYVGLAVRYRGTPVTTLTIMGPPCPSPSIGCGDFP